jgi:hypothetical protein
VSNPLRNGHLPHRRRTLLHLLGGQRRRLRFDQCRRLCDIARHVVDCAFDMRCPAFVLRRVHVHGSERGQRAADPSPSLPVVVGGRLVHGLRRRFGGTRGWGRAVVGRMLRRNDLVLVPLGRCRRACCCCRRACCCWLLGQAQRRPVQQPISLPHDISVLIDLVFLFVIIVVVQLRQVGQEPRLEGGNSRGSTNAVAFAVVGRFVDDGFGRRRTRSPRVTSSFGLRHQEQ